ncbi:hypothetical protein AKJ09_04117 [Labilithrix luteola]|uniref:Uncharacterized protein n=1 Tax=Labilithrix luteola TaxID=1391654 RepID=A0A0K1PV92_9BACT|nr:hypothetical protein [Labilithrix luteola]AKU97453.1 hypothetical protein AKJ09_04117 [Labilithrix luteola]
MAESPDDRDDAAIAAVCASALGFALTLGALGTYGRRTAISVAVGTFIAVANLLMMRAIVRSIIRPPPEGELPEGETPEDVPTTLATDNVGDGGSADEESASSESASSEKDGKRGGTLWGIFAFFKLFILFGGIWVLLTKRMVDPIPLVVGYGVLPLGIAASAFVRNPVPPRKRGR